jgi:hypothetical protein
MAKNKGGRPPKSVDVVVRQQDELLERHASGETITAICRDMGLSIAAPWRWQDKDPDGFGKRYARAREEHAHALAASIADIADGTDQLSLTAAEIAEVAALELDPKQRAEFLRMFQSSAIQRDRLRVDARKWVTAKALPRIYADRQQVEHSGKVGLEDLLNQSHTA